MFPKRGGGELLFISYHYPKKESITSISNYPPKNLSALFSLSSLFVIHKKNFPSNNKFKKKEVKIGIDVSNKKSKENKGKVEMPHEGLG